MSQCGPWTKSKIKCKEKVVTTTKPTCPWVLLVSRPNEEEDWMVKTLVKDHNCVQSRSIRACTADFMAKNIIPQVESNPTIPIKALREDLTKRYGISMFKMKAFRAKQIAQKHVFGDYEKQYSMLRSYVLELQACNEGTTVKIDVHPESNLSSQTRIFRRIYVCLGALKKGFKAGLREFLGVDGAFIKGPYPGQCLTAVGLDSNNGIYPIAYAIVEAETLSSWTWFLECLGDDLELDASSNFTFSSDRQKGIILAIIKVFPNAEHRYCLHHIHENMKLKWRGKEYRNHLWKCATATPISHFEFEMEEFRKYDVKAHDWLKLIPAKHWSRAHFSGRTRSDALLNNMCEVLNSKLVDAREKPVITCLEYIREYLMKRICIVQHEIDKCKGGLTPTTTRMLNGLKKEAEQHTCIFNGAEKTQVTTPTKEQYVVNLKAKTCTCRYWEITGMPCSHVISAIWDKVEHGGKNVPSVEQWVHPIYWLDTWKAMYQFKVDPINGRSMWPKSDFPITLTAPKHHTQVGRPKKKRTRAADEQVKHGKNLSRKYLTVKCSKCGNKGHNARTCKGQGGQPKVKKVAAKRQKKDEQGKQIDKQGGKKQLVS